MLAGGVDLAGAMALDGAHGGDQAILDRDISNIGGRPLSTAAVGLKSEGDGPAGDGCVAKLWGAWLLERAHRAVNDSPSAEDDVVGHGL